MNRVSSPPPGASAPWPLELDAAGAQRLLAAAGDIVLWLDVAGTVVEVQARDRELAKAVRRDWRGRAWGDVVTVESRDKVAQLLADALAPGDAPPVWRQLNHPSKDGPDLPVLYAAMRAGGTARGRQGLRLVAVGRDLRDTEVLQRRLVEAQQTMERDYWRFREAETRYRSLFQSSSEAVLIVDAASQRVAEANPAAQQLLESAGERGARPPRVVGAGWIGLFAPDAAEPLAAALAAARSVGKHDAVQVDLAGGRVSVSVNIGFFRQDQAAFVLVRLVPRLAVRRGARGAAALPVAADAGAELPGAFVRNAADAIAFTDAAGRVVSVNRSFTRLAQLSSDDQARGQSLDRWVGRTGVELAVLLANLREGGSAGLFTTTMRGELGMSTEVEIAASPLEPPGEASFAFSMRDLGRRLAPAEEALPAVPASVKQLTELVGRVPIKQIVAETSDLIERLSIETALSMTRDNRALAAQLLGLSRQSLYVKLRRFGIGGLGADDETAASVNPD
ncbi:MAG: transcriptional regulator PpsR [Rubrivivax sp.]